MKKTLNVLAGAGGMAAVMVALATLAMPAISLAAYVAAGRSVALPAAIASSTSTNAYLAGSTVDATGPVNGDLVVGGGTVVISSAVANDIMAVGGTINIIGATAQDVRVMGGNLTIGGKFSGELMAAGGTITVISDSTIAKDSYIAAGNLDFMGVESGSLNIAGGNVRIDGTVNGNLFVKRASTVTIGADAVIKGNFEYSASAPAIVESGAQIVGQTTFHQIAGANAGAGAGTSGQNAANRLGILAAIFTFWLIAKFLVVLTAAYLLWYLRRKDMAAVIEDVRTHFWKKLFVGFAFLVLIPIGAIILFVTLIGAIPALVALLIYGTLLVLTIPIAVIVTSAILMALFKKNMAALRWYHILIGAVVYTLLAFIPFLGWIAGFVIYLVALGSVAGVVGGKFRE